MAATTPQHRTPADRRRLLAIGGVSALAIATIVLCVLALTQFRGVPGEGPIASPPPAPSPTPSPSPTSDVIETPTPTPPAPVALVPPTRLLAAFDSARVYRATAAACPDPRSAFELSSDGGATWEGSDIADRTGSSAALNLTAGGPDFVRLVTLRTEDCAPQYIRSFVGGIDWEVFDSELPVTWFFNPADPSIVHSPEGDRSTPCTAVSLAAAGDRAAVLCTDSTVFTTADAAATWSAATPIANAAAIAVSANGYRIAVLNAEGCAGIQLGELVDGSMQGLGACLTVNAGQADVALTTAGDGTTFVWAGDVFSGSPDGGATW